MTTNFPNPVDGDVQALVDRCKTISQWAEKYGDNANVMLPAHEAHELARIALAALTAEPALWSYWFNDETHYQPAKFGRPQLKNGKHVLETFYTAPPAQLLRPVELPDISAGKYYTEEGAFMAFDYKRDLNAAIRAAGGEVKND